MLHQQGEYVRAALKSMEDLVSEPTKKVNVLVRFLGLFITCRDSMVHFGNSQCGL